MQSNLFDKKRSFTKHNYISKNFHHCDTKKKYCLSWFITVGIQKFILSSLI